MTSYGKQIIITFLISIILSYPATVTSQVCPDPCQYSPPAIPTPGPPAGSNSPPSPIKLTNAGPPAGPNNLPPPYNRTNAPAPPDNMVPWFPYYRRPLPNSDQSSSASILIWGWAAAIISATSLVFS
ncbi:hypothetical protein POM88_030837 [Heracleum sosnowskyi]|uniref:Uncharacterized protein n=1 Tax=Heracleum sosnowskyi TaxID=360622 RepID=A0AAD8MJ62_9APIA|nr:hypothetical protein POM88_030837 [Heracleum sosnowskyi]